MKKLFASFVYESESGSSMSRCALTIFLFVSFTDVYFIATLSFVWKVTAITLVSCLPLYILKYLRRRFSPPSYSKLTSWALYCLARLSPACSLTAHSAQTNLKVLERQVWFAPTFTLILKLQVWFFQIFGQRASLVVRLVLSRCLYIQEWTLVWRSPGAIRSESCNLSTI